MAQHQLSAELLLQRALDYELLTERQFQEVWASVGSRMAPVEEVKKQLLRGEYMTNYQLERLAKGERSGFFYGPYKVLYAVGDGHVRPRVPRRASPDGRDRRPEGAAKALQRPRQAGPGQARRPVHSRRQAGAHAAASQHRAHLRCRLRRQVALPGHGVRRGLEPPRPRQDPHQDRAAAGHAADDGAWSKGCATPSNTA